MAQAALDAVNYHLDEGDYDETAWAKPDDQEPEEPTLPRAPVKNAGRAAPKKKTQRDEEIAQKRRESAYHATLVRNQKAAQRRAMEEENLILRTDVEKLHMEIDRLKRAQQRESRSEPPPKARKVDTRQPEASPPVVNNYYYPPARGESEEKNPLHAIFVKLGAAAALASAPFLFKFLKTSDEDEADYRKGHLVDLE